MAVEEFTGSSEKVEDTTAESGEELWDVSGDGGGGGGNSRDGRDDCMIHKVYG